MRRTRWGYNPALLDTVNGCSHMVQLGCAPRKARGHAPFLLPIERTCYMDEDDNKELRNETNEDNDAREEDIVSDVDADTKDVIETEDRNEGDYEKRFSSIEATLDKILGQISSIREAQGVMVENGAVIQEVDDDLDFTDADNFVPPTELNLLI